MQKRISFVLILIISILVLACSSQNTGKEQTLNSDTTEVFSSGTYGYDLDFLKAHKLDVIELKDKSSDASLIIIPKLQGRVMTSSAAGKAGKSFGWINYRLFESGEASKQFNPYGGEERFWLGPEGGPFSLYFPEGKEQVFENWMVPSVLDTEGFDVLSSDDQHVTLVKNTLLKNASGNEFEIGIERTVSILARDTLSELLNVNLPADLDIVAYESVNTIKNNGDQIWRKATGLPSVWMLCMFNPSPSTTVFIPYREDAEGTVVNDEYFGKVPSDRLQVDKRIIYFKIDGKLRSKIGLPPERAKGICGSYDMEQEILTLLWCSIPESPQEYVNSKWGKQENPYLGDVINSYNDGPVEGGSVMGPFYEIETSSPAAGLEPGESLSHSQRIIHMQGSAVELAWVVKNLAHLDLLNLEEKFQEP